MSTRRARIKAVASLPVRRKAQCKDAVPEVPEATKNIPAVPEPQESATEKERPKLTPSSDADAPRRRATKASAKQPVTKLPTSDNSPLEKPPISIPVSGPSKQHNPSPVPVEESVVPSAVSEPLDLGEECSFDPIIPLPTSNKNRPKLRPIPKLALRRNSLQGSASETEDAPEPVPPLASAAPVSAPAAAAVPVAPLPAPPSQGAPPTPAPARQRPRGARARNVPRKAGAPGAHNALTMYDLIFYNPPNNAIQREEVPIAPVPEPIEEVPLAELPEPPEAAPVPQVKLGPNGEIVIDEQSLVIETSEAVRSRQRLSRLAVVWDGGGGGGRGVYGRGPRCREWGRAETLRFYRALHTLGTDFSLMLSLFPGRSRRDLKVKFKKEEKQNGVLVDRALMNPLQFDIAHLEEEAALLAEEAKASAPTAKPTERKRKQQKTSTALQSIQSEEDSTLRQPPKNPKMPRVSSQTLRSDSLALLPPESPAFAHLPTSPPSPSSLEPGSLVVLAGTPLRAFLAQKVDGEMRLCPVSLPEDVVKTIAGQVGTTAVS